MRAIEIADDDQKTLKWGHAPRPLCGPQDIVIRNYATALNRADLLQRKGLYPVPEKASPILGLECAGIVAEVGPEVEGWAVGDRVCSLLSGGGYAEYVSTPYELALPIPGFMTFAEAASLPEALYTAYLNLILEANLREDESVLVHAAGSGVGLAALQILGILGARAFGTASEAKLERIRDFGAAAIDRNKLDFVDFVLDETHGDGVDVVLDCVGGAYLEKNQKVLARGGRLVVIGLLGGADGELDLRQLLMKRQSVIGSVLRSRTIAEKIAITMDLARDVWPYVMSGDIVATIDSEFGIESANEAHARMKDNLNVGKIVLNIP